MTSPDPTPPASGPPSGAAPVRQATPGLLQVGVVGSILHDLDTGITFKVLCSCPRSTPREHTRRAIEQNPARYRLPSADELRAYFAPAVTTPPATAAAPAVPAAPQAPAPVASPETPA